MLRIILLLVIIFIYNGSDLFAEVKMTENKSYPTKIMFIHHSVGGQWLAHNYGGLANELNKNNYYVNDITYGWEPETLHNSFMKKVKRKVYNLIGSTNISAYGIGNRTDIGQMPEWFLGFDSDLIMSSVFQQNMETNNFGDHSNSTSKYPIVDPNPSKENEIIIFKSCYPNSNILGNATDSASKSEVPKRGFVAESSDHTMANCKRIFNDLLLYFSSRPDKFFVVMTPPPQSKLPLDGQVARAFSNWLVNDWLSDNNYSHGNVMVFDLFNVLTSSLESNKNDAGESQGNHHRIWSGKVQHITQTTNNLLVYRTNDDHPAPEGLQKATKEFVPLLNYYFKIWKQGF